MILTGSSASSVAVYTGTPFVQIGDLTITPGQHVDGVWWDVQVDGWDEPASVTERTEQRNADHGAWTKQGYYEARTVEIKGLLVSPVRSERSRAWAQLKAAVPSFDPVLVTVAVVGEPVLQGTFVQGGAPILNQDGGASWEFSFSLIAPDPRRYDVAETTALTGLPVTSGGLSLPISLPLSIGAVTTSGLLTLVNSGDMPTRPTFTITGPCPPCTITHSSGRRLTVPDAVPAGRSLTLDVDSRTALLDGTASRVVTGTWFEFAPGVNEVQFSSATYDAAALLSVSFRSAWR